MDFQNLKNIDEKFVLHTYGRANVAFVKGKGATLFDTDGRDFIDFGSGIGVSCLGYAHKAHKKALKKSAKLIHTSNLYHIEPQAKLAQKLVESFKTQARAKADYRVFFSNSGAEANECAIKIARKAGEASGRYKIITLDSSFHGRTIASLKATAQSKFHAHFGPFPDGFVYAKDLNDVKNHIDDKTCAVLLELVQGEGGINVLDRAKVRELAFLLREKEILLMVDEVQSGIYRTGEMFASVHFGIKPCVITMAKGLAGGVPIGACMTSLIDVFEPSDHGSTFGGNFLSTNAGLATLSELEKIKENGELARTIEIFNGYLDKLASEFSNLIEARVGLGLMCGLKFRDEQKQKAFLTKCFENRVLVLNSGRGVARFLPPLVISESEIKDGFKRVRRAIKGVL